MTPNYNLLPQSWWGLCFSASTIRTLNTQLIWNWQHYWEFSLSCRLLLKM